MSIALAFDFQATFHVWAEFDLLLSQFIGNQTESKRKENNKIFFFNWLKYQWIVRKVGLHNDIQITHALLKKLH